MNKKSLVTFVRRSLIGREATADEQQTFHYKRVEQGVGYAFDTLLSQMRLDESGLAKVESYYVKHYYNQPVKESNGYRYFGVSDSIVSIGEGKGIWYVQPSGGGAPLSQSTRPSTSLFNNMAVGSVMNTTVWRFGNIATNRQIIIENIGTSPNEDIRAVDFGVVRAFSSYGEDEDVVVPDGRVDLLQELVRTWLKESAYVDKTNNNQ